MDTTVIVVIVVSALIIVGGPIVGHFASKASAKAEKEELNKTNSK